MNPEFSLFSHVLSQLWEGLSIVVSLYLHSARCLQDCGAITLPNIATIANTGQLNATTITTITSAEPAKISFNHNYPRCPWGSFKIVNNLWRGWPIQMKIVIKWYKENYKSTWSWSKIHSKVSSVPRRSSSSKLLPISCFVWNMWVFLYLFAYPCFWKHSAPYYHGSTLKSGFFFNEMWKIIGQIDDFDWFLTTLVIWGCF